MFEHNIIVQQPPPHLSLATVNEFTEDILILEGHARPPACKSINDIVTSTQIDWLLRYSNDTDDIGSV